MEHALEVTAVATSLLAAVCYLIGRAGLVGWYETAGVPQLVFSWSAQDVIIRGLTDEDTWFLVLVSFAGSALYFALLRGENDLVWIGRAAKLTSLPNDEFQVWVTADIFNTMAPDVKQYEQREVWQARTWSKMNDLLIHGSSWGFVL